MCRLIDHVYIRGSKQPIRLFTIDLDIAELEVQTRFVERVYKNRFKVRQLREARKNEKWSDDFQVWEAFPQDDDILTMRQAFFPEFFQRYAMAYRNYESGA